MTTARDFETMTIEEFLDLSEAGLAIRVREAETNAELIQMYDLSEELLRQWDVFADYVDDEKTLRSKHPDDYPTPALGPDAGGERPEPDRSDDAQANHL